MKTIKFLTLILIVNLMIATAMHWSIANKLFVILNAVAVLLLIAMKVFARKD